jgi:hypothetical protein
MEALNHGITRFSPVGEYLRLVILRRLSRGPARVEEINKLAEEAVKQLHVKYDWQVWPKLLTKEVEIKDGTVMATNYGKWLLEQTDEEIAKYVQKWLGISP